MMNMNPNPSQPPPPPPPQEKRGRRFRPFRLLKTLLWIGLALVLTVGIIRFGPAVYNRFFGAGNAQWLSERFSEALHDKNELVVLQKRLSGRENVTQTAWLVGTVQEVLVPYEYSLSYVVDLSLARVGVEDNDIVVRLPAPIPRYGKLDVDRDKVKKRDWLLPVTTERYAAILSEIETRLYDECVGDAKNADAAWANTVSNMESLFAGVAASEGLGVSHTIRVLRDESLTQMETSATPGGSAARRYGVAA